ncbi:signal peptidase I [Streptomyces sp. 3211.6]|uniref:signal peptidase I n=1 Tax=Streptomyces TaxID=1883 RepID=UPI0009A4CEC5|nr:MULTISPECIES: signal peptidase I [Streptomyces]RKT07165.1 signal peptidase I [Streptomyces sp. 3211.6]RPF45228.1 signal peptidase I [Streptomyces sp. Ag109_G2-6]
MGGTQAIRASGRDGRGGLGNTLSGIAVAIGFALFLGGFVWGALVYQPYTVPTNSMVPTVQPGDRVLAQRIGGAEVHRGDVVVFKDAQWSDSPMVKRVVAVGGDTVGCCGQGGRLTVNGKPLEEPYVDRAGHDALAAGTTNFEVRVPEGNLFLMGDRRSGSLDSRAHLQDAGQGTVPRSAVEARVDALAWPNPGMLDRPQAFAALPGGTSQPGPLRLQVAAVVAGAALVVLGAAYGPVARVLGRGRSRGRSGGR